MFWRYDAWRCPHTNPIMCFMHEDNPLTCGNNTELARPYLTIPTSSCAVEHLFSAQDKWTIFTASPGSLSLCLRHHDFLVLNFKYFVMTFRTPSSTFSPSKVPWSLPIIFFSFLFPSSQSTATVRGETLPIHNHERQKSS